MLSTVPITYSFLPFKDFATEVERAAILKDSPETGSAFISVQKTRKAQKALMKDLPVLE
jgi:hypothetical protein